MIKATAIIEMLADVADGSLREMIESWTREPLAGEALEDYEALCAIRDAACEAKAVSINEAMACGEEAASQAIEAEQA